MLPWCKNSAMRQRGTSIGTLPLIERRQVRRLDGVSARGNWHRQRSDETHDPRKQRSLRSYDHLFIHRRLCTSPHATTRPNTASMRSIAIDVRSPDTAQPCRTCSIPSRTRRKILPGTDIRRNTKDPSCVVPNCTPGSECVWTTFRPRTQAGPHPSHSQLRLSGTVRLLRPGRQVARSSFVSFFLSDIE